MAKTLGIYKNGNYWVEIMDDGTKIRVNNLDNHTPAFAESIDVTITKRCDGNCSFCYAECTPDGKHGNILNKALLNSLHRYTEIALNGNDLSHPDLDKFLSIMKDKKIIANMTVNQKHFLKHFARILNWQMNQYIYGLGVSYTGRDVEFIKKVQLFPNAVIHVINGILTPDDIEFLSNKNLKLLILGYKHKGRGVDFEEKNGEEIKKNQQYLKEVLPSLQDKFRVICFDNLALDQLDVKSWLSKEEFESYYMGDEGQFTFYLDLVDNVFAKSSLETEYFPMRDSVDDMFRFLRERSKMKSS